MNLPYRENRNTQLRETSAKCLLNIQRFFTKVAPLIECSQKLAKFCKKVF